jgi:hypothetical protein
MYEDQADSAHRDYMSAQQAAQEEEQKMQKAITIRIILESSWRGY